MRTISKADLATRLLIEVVREVEATGEPVVITEEGRPIIEIRPVPFSRYTVDEIFGPFRGKVTYAEDVNTPTIEEWETV